MFKNNRSHVNIRQSIFLSSCQVEEKTEEVDENKTKTKDKDYHTGDSTEHITKETISKENINSRGVKNKTKKVSIKKKEKGSKKETRDSFETEEKTRKNV